MDEALLELFYMVNERYPDCETVEQLEETDHLTKKICYTRVEEEFEPDYFLIAGLTEKGFGYIKSDSPQIPPKGPYIRVN